MVFAQNACVGEIHSFLCMGLCVSVCTHVYACVLPGVCVCVFDCGACLCMHLRMCVHVSVCVRMCV